MNKAGIIGLGMCDSCHSLVRSLRLVWVGVSPRYLCDGCRVAAAEREMRKNSAEYQRFSVAMDTGTGDGREEVSMWSTARAWNIVDAAKHVGLEIDGFEREGKGYRFRVKLGRKRLGDSADIEAGQRATDRRYQRVSGDGSPMQWKSAERRARRVAAVCWHGYRDFIRELYAAEGNCIVRTGLCTYRSEDTSNGCIWIPETGM